MIFRSRDLTLIGVSRVAELESEGSLVVLPKPVESPVPPVQEDILGALLEEDETYVGCEFSGTRWTTDQYALAEVHGDYIAGIPESAPEALRHRILETTTGTGGTGGEAPPAGVATGGRSGGRKTIPASFSVRDLVVGGDAHRRALEGVLREPQSWVVIHLFRDIHSTLVYAERFGELLPLMSEAVGRGAKIDILWGASPDEESGVVSEEVVKCREALGEDDVLGRHIKLHSFSTGSHAKLMLADDGRGGVVGCVGSCNWLSTGFGSLDVSVRFRDPNVVAEIASYLSQLARTPNGHASRLTNDLAGFALNLRRSPGVAEDAGKSGTLVTFVSGADHNAFVQRARNEARKRIVVASHRLSPVGRTSVVVPTAVTAGETGADVKLYYERLFGKMTGEMAAALADENPGIVLRRVREARLHAKVLAWDNDDVVISSLNWLSSDPPDGDVNGEIGVHVRKKGIGEVVASRLLSRLSGGNSGAGERETGVS